MDPLAEFLPWTGSGSHRRPESVRIRSKTVYSVTLQDFLMKILLLLSHVLLLLLLYVVIDIMTFPLAASCVMSVVTWLVQLLQLQHSTFQQYLSPT